MTSKEFKENVKNKNLDDLVAKVKELPVFDTLLTGTGKNDFLDETVFKLLVMSSIIADNELGLLFNYISSEITLGLLYQKIINEEKGVKSGTENQEN